MSDRICSIEGCVGEVKARGYCNKHYTRWRFHGHPEKYIKTPDGEALKYYHEVVIPHQGYECLIWPYHRNREGYARLETLRKRGRSCLVHRAACVDVNGPPPSEDYEAAHICGGGANGCVNPRHLAWKTRTENEQDKLRHGTVPRGAKSPFSKIDPEQVIAIRALHGRLSQAKIASLFGVSQSHVSDIIRGRKWGWLSINQNQSLSYDEAQK